jgi:hypothetical protein
MGWKSKATKTRVQNLYRKPTVEEVDNTHCNQVQVTVPTADLDLDDIIAQLGIETLPELDEEEEDDEGLTKDAEDDTDIMEISKLEVFAAALEQAQAVATAAEREREKGNKRLKWYAGNSARTKRRHVQKEREFAKNGYPSISRWLGSRKGLGIETIQETAIQSDSEVNTTDSDDKVEFVEILQDSIQSDQRNMVSIIALE